VAEALVQVNPIFLGHWLDALRPVRGRLARSLEAIFVRGGSEAQHELATNILADYAADDPDRLASLLVAADPKAYLALFPIAERQAEKVLPHFVAELEKRVTIDWNDAPLDPSWTTPDPALASRIEAAQGQLAERLAFCQAMPLDEFTATAAALRPSGYRPVRVHPFAYGSSVSVAAAWARDGRKWRIASGLAAGEVYPRDASHRLEKFIPVDIASYAAIDPQGKPAERFAVLWVERGGPGDVDQFYVDATGVNALQYRAIANARLGRKKLALEDLALLRKGAAVESIKLYTAAVVGADLGEGQDEAFGRLEAALKDRPGDPALAYDAACGYALASRALARPGRAGGRRQAERAIQLLRTAIDNGYSDFDHIQEDSDLDPIRGLPAFSEVIAARQSDRRHAAVWIADARFERASCYGLDPEAHLEHCRKLAVDGYRPVSLSASRTTPDGAPVTASVWERPLVSEPAKDDLAERQARAAVSLVRLGHAGDVWPLFRHCADPRLRSFILNWLRPLGADPKTIAAALDSPEFSARPAERGGGGRSRRSAEGGAGEGSSRPGPAGTEAVGRIANPSYGPGEGSSSQLMDAILYHPETSIRRALILALGTYGPDALSPGERGPLVAKLLDLYKNDPDSGIHGAAEWTLRQFNEQAKLRAADAGLIQLNDRGDRRWLVNSQGQTFALIEGPVEYTMGSPPTEPARNSSEVAHRRLIPRRFAIAAKEVSVSQYQEFARENPRFAVERRDLHKSSPDPDGPMIGVSWFGAVAYCNWLSKREGLPEDQWCYLRNTKGEYDQEMTIPADVLKRNGYRLPTEAEWEYACRAGTITSRYHGLSLELLAKYARYAGNSAEHAWPRGSLLPNELGLFDMLGNVYEWCDDRYYRYGASGNRVAIDNINISEHIDTNPRLLRGGAFSYPAAFVRSANRSGLAPALRVAYYGFRPSRTYH